MKKGLVLEGGAMRGMYTAGVLDVMMEEKFEVDGIVGVSAGAVFGSNYKSRQIGRGIRYNKKYCNDPRYGSFCSLIKTGDMFEAEFCYNELPQKLDPFDQKTYEENPVDFYAVCTDVHTGKAVYHLCNKGDASDVQWMRASASMPIVSKIVSIDGYGLLDGGIADSIPLFWFREQGYKKTIVVLTRTADYRKGKNRIMPIARRVLKKYPAVVEAMAKRHIIYNETLDRMKELEESGEIFVLRPSRLVKVAKNEKNPEKLQEMYDLGRKDALSNLEAMRKYMEES